MPGRIAGNKKVEGIIMKIKASQLAGWYKNFADWLLHQDKDEWLKDMRGSLSLTASIIATMTFQSGLNPPGGVLQGDANDIKDFMPSSKNCNSSHPCPGEAVVAAVYPNAYVRFMICNTICFIASVSVCLLLVSGLSLNHRFPTWLLLIGMCITMVTLTLTYLFGVIMITPHAVLGSSNIPIFGAFGAVLLAFVALYGTISLLQTSRIVIWYVNRDKKQSGEETSKENKETSKENKETSISVD